MSSGIYQFLCTSNNDRYIGSSVNIEERWKRHLKDLRGNKHHSKYMQRSFNKYGIQSIQISVLEICEPDMLLTREQYYIDTLSPKFNTCKVAGSPKGTKQSKKACEAKRKYAIEHNVKPPRSDIPVIMVDTKTGKELRRFDSMTQACIFCGKDGSWGSMIRAVINRKRKSAMGYSWKLVLDNPEEA